MFRTLLLLTLLLSFPAHFAKDKQAIDDYITKVMATFNIPGVAVGVIKDGDVVHMQGYGIADIETGRAVDEYTIFKIASNSKAFTAAGLAILVDQEKMNWDDKVSQHLPEFKMYDDYASQEFNVIDILTHRSGLGLGAGDMMLWPEPTKFTRKQLVRNLRHLKPAYGFRERYAYDNTLYIVAGEISAAISGKSWEQYIEDSIFKPLNMKHCYAGGVDTKVNPNVVATHLYMDGKVVVDQPNRIRPETTLMAAAGGVKCSVHDLMIWLDLQLRLGTTKDGLQLYSEKQAQKMWYPVTPLRVSERAREMDKTNYRGYGLGWRSNDHHGHWLVGHTGTLSGAMSQITLVPRENLGIVVLLNQSTGYARNAIMRKLVDHYLDLPATDWLAYYIEQREERLAWLQSDEAKDQGMVLPPLKTIPDKTSNNKRLGTYQDPWFGKITLSRENDHVVFRAEMVPRLVGKAYWFDDDTWWVKWDNRSFEADAWLRFERVDGKLQLTMERMAEDSDWSFNFQDLLLTKVRW